MTDLHKIKDKIARQHGYKDWFHMVSSKLGPYIPFDEVVEKYTAAHTDALRERVKALEEKNRWDGSRWAKDRIEQGKKHEADMMEACGRIVELEDRVKELKAKIASYESAIDGLKKVVDSLYNLK